MMKKITEKRIVHLVLLLLLVGVDQITKIWARSALKGKEDINVLPNLLIFSYLENRGAIWGNLQNKTVF